MSKPITGCTADSFRVPNYNTLRELREARGMTQSELARRSGVNVKCINECEQWVTGLSLKSIQKISKVLNVPVGFISEQITRWDNVLS